MFARLASVIAVAASVLLHGSAPAALILYEGFDYATPGNVTGQSGGVGWPAGTTWQGIASMSLVSPGLEYPDIASSGNAAEVSTARAEANYRAWNSDLFTTDGNVLWFSFLLNTNVTTSDLRAFPLGSTGTTGAGVFVIGTSIRADIDSQRSDSLTFSHDETNLVVARLQFSDTSGQDSVRVWLNPTLDQEPTTGYVEQKGDFPVFTSGGEPIPYNIYVRGGSTWGGIVDELRLETTFFGAEPVFKLDFNGLGAETQAGYYAMATDSANENRAFTDAATFSHVFGPGEHVGVEFDGDRAKRRNPLTGGPYQDLSQLLRDWYGVSTGEFSVSLSLPLGTYQLTSFHHDVLVGAGQSISITLNDAAGTSTASAVQTGGTTPEEIGSFTGNVTSDGTEPITLTYASSSQIGINGLHLEPFGFWRSPSGGLWSDSGNWMHGHVAEGAGTIASFRGVNIWDDMTVSLDSSRTLHGLAFGNLDPASPAGWIIDDNGDPDNTITLAGTAPVITVNDLGSGKVAEIAVRLAGDGGLRKDGPGTLVLARENTYTGTTEVAAGTLKLGPDGAIAQSGVLAVRAGATLDVAEVPDGFSVLDGQTLSGAGSVAGQTTIDAGAVLAPGDSLGTLTFSDDLMLAEGAAVDWQFLSAGTAGIHYASMAGPTVVLPDARHGVALNIQGLEGHNLRGGDTFTLFQGNVAVGETTLSAGTDVTSLFSISDDVGWWGSWEVAAGSLTLTAVDPMFKLDFNGNNGPTQPGYHAISAGNMGDDFTRTATFTDALGPDESVTVQFEGNRARDRDPLTGGPFLYQSDLLQDWFGKHHTDDFRLTLTLPPGTYQLTSFHHDRLGGTRNATVTVNDILGESSVDYQDTGGYAPNTIGTFTGNVTSDGTQEVTLVYAAPSAVQIGINGLHVEPFGFWNGGQSGLWSDSTNWMHGHVAEGAGTIASFRMANPTSDVVVSLDSSRTLYGMAFGDLDPASPAGWKIDNNGDPANTITLSAAPSTITVNELGAGKAAEIAVRLEGTGGIVKDGPGTLVLSGDNIYAGTTTVLAGVLNVRHNHALGTAGTGTVVSSGAALEFEGGATIEDAPLTATGSGPSGAGVLRSISGNNAWTGPIAFGGDSTIGVDADTLTVSGVLSGGGLTKVGAGTLAITTATSSFPALWVNEGEVALTGGANVTTNSRLYVGQGSSDDGTLTVGNGATIFFDSTGTEFRVGVSGTGKIVQSGGLVQQRATGAMYLGFNAGAVGRYEISGGTLDQGSLSIGGHGGAGTGSFEQTGGDVIARRDVRIGRSGGSGWYTLSGGTLSIIGSGGWLYVGHDGSGSTASFIQSDGIVDAQAGVQLGRESGVSGTYTMSGGELRVPSIAAGLGTAQFDWSGGIVRPRTGGNLAVTAPLTLTGISATFDSSDVGGSARTITVNAAIGEDGGSWGLTKQGTGTLALGAVNAYTGATDVAAGTLKLGPAGSIAQSSAITVYPGAIFDVAEVTGGFSVAGGQTLAGSGTVVGDTTIASGGVLQPGMSPGKLTFEDNLTLDDGAVWNWEFLSAGTGGIDYDQVAGSTLVLSADPGSEIELNVFGLPGHSVTWYEEFTVFEGDVENFSAGLFRIENHSDWTRGWQVSLGEGGSNLLLTAVPEPGAWLLVLWALACGLLVRRRG